MARVVALTKQNYAKRDYNPGDVYEASEEDARVLVMAKVCRVAEPDTPITDISKMKKNTYKHRSLRSEK